VSAVSATSTVFTVSIAISVFDEVPFTGAVLTAGATRPRAPILIRRRRRPTERHVAPARRDPTPLAGRTV
jgi:hypothetical protein